MRAERMNKSTMTMPERQQANNEDTAITRTDLLRLLQEGGSSAKKTPWRRDSPTDGIITRVSLVISTRPDGFTGACAVGTLKRKPCVGFPQNGTTPGSREWPGLFYTGTSSSMISSTVSSITVLPN